MPVAPDTTVLIADPAVIAIPVLECGEPLVSLPSRLCARGPVRVRRALQVRLEEAQLLLPRWLRIGVVEGHRSGAAQQAIVEAYRRQVQLDHPTADGDEVDRLVSRHVAPLRNAPHVAGAAVDLTLLDAAGDELWMGTAIDATPEQSEGRCYTDCAGLDARASAQRALLCGVLSRVGLVNYPPEWWHWSYGDRYWAHATGADHALYGPVER